LSNLSKKKKKKKMTLMMKWAHGADRDGLNRPICVVVVAGGYCLDACHGEEHHDAVASPLADRDGPLADALLVALVY